MSAKVFASASREQPAVAIYPNLAGKTAFVTGGSKGIGAATCGLLAANGVKVAVVARGAETAEELADELRTGGADAVALVADCADADAVDAARRAAEEQLGPVDLLVPFAGGFERVHAGRGDDARGMARGARREPNLHLHHRA